MEESAALAAVEPLTAGSIVAKLLLLWEEVLGVGAGEEDSFFALGGDSVLLMTLLLRIEDECEAVLDTAEIYDAPTPTQLALRILSALENGDVAGYEQGQF